MESITQHVSRYLFSEGNLNVFAVLDGAAVPDLLKNFHLLRPEYVCLYRGELQPDMAEVAPYLVQLEPNSKFTDWVVGGGWGKHWGIFARSGTGLREMRRHFRQFLIVYDDAGKPLIFRYYDPRVLREYLPTCNVEELATIFGPVETYLLESEDAGTLLRFRQTRGFLKQEKRQFTTDEQERVARERAEEERRREALKPTAIERERPGPRDDDMQQSLVNFWTTMRKIKPPKK